jgi:23S rRNA (uracil1939-C5)-methyltransferase
LLVNKPKKGDIIEVQIENMGFEGSGIGRINGDFVVFVPKSVPGDIVKAKIRKTKKNFAEAAIEQILGNSDHRLIPKCEHFGTCNGCKMQNVDYHFQLEIKRQHVSDSFERIGGFVNLQIPPVIGSDNIFFYRNKLEFSFSNNKWLTEADMHKLSAAKSFALGYHIPGFIDKILDINKCWLQSDFSNKILNLTRNFFKERSCSVYSTKTSSGYLRFLVIRESANTSDLMINLITHTNDEKLIDEYSALIQNEIPEVTTLVNSISTTKAQVAQADYCNIIFGKGYIEEKIGNYRFSISPNSFFQTNSIQSLILFDSACVIATF